MERINTDLIAHSLAICGMTSYRVTILELVQKLNEIQEHVEDLESLMSREIMADLVQPAELREVVAELGSGWKIERQVTPPNASAATLDAQQIETLTGTGTDADVIAVDSREEGGWVQTYCGAVE